MDELERELEPELEAGRLGRMVELATALERLEGRVTELEARLDGGTAALVERLERLER
jgi:hypothetical protein